jgi:hypothetical protein
MKEYDDPERDTFIDNRVAQLIQDFSEDELRELAALTGLNDEHTAEECAEAVAANEYDNKEKYPWD